MGSHLLLVCFCKLDFSLVMQPPCHFCISQNVLTLISPCFLMDMASTHTQRIHSVPTSTSPNKYNVAVFCTSMPIFEYFDPTPLQPELHLPQRGGSPHLRSQRGADHRAAPAAAAPDAAPAPAPAPAQPHVPSLLRLGPGHGGGELGGGGEDG